MRQKAWCGLRAHLRPSKSFPRCVYEVKDWKGEQEKEGDAKGGKGTVLECVSHEDRKEGNPIEEVGSE